MISSQSDFWGQECPKGKKLAKIEISKVERLIDQSTMSERLHVAKSTGDKSSKQIHCLEGSIELLASCMKWNQQTRPKCCKHVYWEGWNWFSNCWWEEFFVHNGQCSSIKGEFYSPTKSISQASKVAAVQLLLRQHQTICHVIIQEIIQCSARQMVSGRFTPPFTYWFFVGSQT